MSKYDDCPYMDNNCCTMVGGCHCFLSDSSLALAKESVEKEAVNHPKHYTQHPSGVECIDITEHMCFNLGNVIKYLWRADLKEDALQDLEKAAWYLDREIAKRKRKVVVHEVT